jgi:hypothetical protein
MFAGTLIPVAESEDRPFDLKETVPS